MIKLPMTAAGYSALENELKIAFGLSGLASFRGSRRPSPTI